MKIRLDTLMFERGLVQSRERARALIIAGEVGVGGRKISKPGESFAPDCEIEIAETCPYVGRGAYKLEQALNTFGIDVAGLICADIGASTGGFTDLLLQRGAKLVYAVDVGHGQLDWKLRNDSRVVVMEKTNARGLSAERFEMKPALATCDLSFISLKLIFPALDVCGIDTIIALIKPQFEAGRGEVGKGGIVRSAQIHKKVIENVAGYAQGNNYVMTDVCRSPITGAKGNTEFLGLFLRKGEQIVAEKIDSEAQK